MDQYNELKKRIERLEQAVFPQTTDDKQLKPITPSSGPTSGIKSLVSTGFFNPPNRKLLNEIMSALIEQGKDYSSPAVGMALGRLSKGQKSILVRHKDKKGDSYVART